jgi:alpha/beta superfamily hydrolase
MHAPDQGSTDNNMRKLFLINICLCLMLGICKAQQPLTYHADQLSFKSSDGKISFSGTLTVPDGAVNVPAVVLISGSGKQDRSGTIAGHPIFTQIADYLSSNGIAVLRIDDRGTGKSTGDFESAMVSDLADDAIRAVQVLKLMPAINPNKIGLMAHAEGASVMLLAAVKNKDISFLISLAGQVITEPDTRLLTRIRVPILAINGDRDALVPGEQNLANWKNYAALGGNRRVRTALLSGLNHLFLPCKTCTVAEYPYLRADFSQRTLHVVTSWIQQSIQY